SPFPYTTLFRSSLLFVDEVREFEGLPLVVDQRDVEVRGWHEPADDLVNLTVQLREILRVVRGFGDPVDGGLDGLRLAPFRHVHGGPDDTDRMAGGIVEDVP